jgi:predicted DNA binding protein
MSVIVEFTLSTDEFVFGSALATVEDMTIELEAIVPTGSKVMPYFWATGEDFESFERHVLSDPDIEAITQLDRIDDTALYRAEWSHDQNTLLGKLAEIEAVVLEAMTMKEGGHFRVRFPTHDLLGKFYNFCTEQDISIEIRRVYTLTEISRAGRIFDLTPEQREAIVLAVQRGYFKVPRETTLSAIADELDISQQAASERVRRGADKVLRGSLLAPSEFYN